jgi:hypothetical protein
METNLDTDLPLQTIFISALHVSPTLSMAVGSTWCGDVVRQGVDDRGFLPFVSSHQPHLCPRGPLGWTNAEFKLTSSEVEV